MADMHKISVMISEEELQAKYQSLVRKSAQIMKGRK